MHSQPHSFSLLRTTAGSCTVTLESPGAEKRIFYIGFCRDCGSRIHSRAQNGLALLMVLAPSRRRLRGPSGSGDENVSLSHNYILLYRNPPSIFSIRIARVCFAAPSRSSSNLPQKSLHSFCRRKVPYQSKKAEIFCKLAQNS